MRARSLSHLSNKALLSELEKAEARDRSATVELLGFLAEVDRRKLYLPAGYPSMYLWCLGTRHYSEAMAARRIAAARAARRFPVILDFLADGRLHLSAVALLSKKLTPRNADELLAAATHRSRREIEVMLAKRFPQPDVAAQVRSLAPASPLPSPVTVRNLALESATVPAQASLSGEAGGRGGDEAPAPRVPAPPTVYPRVAPLAPERYAIQFTMDQAMHDDLVRAQELLGHVVAPGEITEALRRALRELVTKLEKSRFAASHRLQTRSGPAAERGASSARYIPAGIRHEVWARDEGRCTFVSESGRRCGSRAAIEFDHIVPVARGGKSTADNLRLLCRAHNQYEAEQVLGSGFMHSIRMRARGAQSMGAPGS